jgi:hypothetical protein
MSDDFSILTEADKDTLSYGACVGGMTLGGMAVGRWVSLQGFLVGGIADAAYGLMSCKTLQEPIKQKLFSKTSRLTDYEIVARLRALRFQSPSLKKDHALEVLAAIRQEVAANPTKYSRLA